MSARLLEYSKRRCCIKELFCVVVVLSYSPTFFWQDAIFHDKKSQRNLELLDLEMIWTDTVLKAADSNGWRKRRNSAFFKKVFPPFLLSVNFQPACKNCKISNRFYLQYPLHQSICSKIEIGFEISFLISFGLENECRLLTQCLFPSILKTSHGTTSSVLSTLAIFISQSVIFDKIGSQLCFLYIFTIEEICLALEKYLRYINPSITQTTCCL